MNIALAFVIFTGIALGRRPDDRRQRRRRSSPARRPPRPASSRVTSSSASTATPTVPSPAPTRSTDLRVARRRDGHARHQARRRHDERRDGHAADRRGDRRRQGALGIGQPRGVVLEQSITYTPVEAVKIGAQRTVDALGPHRRRSWRSSASAIVNRPDRGAPVAGPDRDRDADRRRVLEARADLHALRRRHPVGQPRDREHPAVPAARWRPDADDHAQALLRRPDQRSEPSS